MKPFTGEFDRFYLCPRCGAEVFTTDSFCLICGFLLKQEPDEDEDDDDEDDERPTYH